MGFYEVENTVDRLSIAVTSCVSQTRNQQVIFMPLKLESGTRSAETLAPYAESQV